MSAQQRGALQVVSGPEQLQDLLVLRHEPDCRIDCAVRQDERQPQLAEERMVETV